MVDILVTGGRGTIGSNICLALARRGRECVATDISDVESPVIEVAEDEVKARVTFEKADVTDFSCMSDIVKKYAIKGIINGAHVSGPEGMDLGDYVFSSIRVSILGLINLLELAREHNLKIVHFSSGSVFKERLDFENPTREDEPRTGHTTSFYSLQKYCQDLLVEYYQRVHGTDVRIARPSRVFGPPETKFSTKKLPPDAILPRVAQGQTKIQLPYAYQKSKDGTATAPQIYTELSYVKDVADGTIKLYDAERSDLKQSAYNVSGGRLHSLDEVIDITKRIFPDREIEFSLSGGEQFGRYIRPPLDISVAKRELNYEPRSLEVAMRDYANWLVTFYEKSRQ